MKQPLVTFTLLWLLFIDLFMFTCVSLSHEACLFPAVILSPGGHRFNAYSVSGNCNYLIHVFACVPACVCVLQVC